MGDSLLLTLFQNGRSECIGQGHRTQIHCRTLCQLSLNAVTHLQSFEMISSCGKSSTSTSSSEDPAACAPVTLSPDILRIIVERLDRSHLPAVRLTCQDFARAVDSHTLTALCIKRWGASPFSGSNKRLLNVQTIQLHAKPDWDHLQKLASGLQQLRTLQIPTHVNSRIGAACAAALTGLTRLDLGTNGKQVPGIPLPKRGSLQLACLKAASFSSSHSSKLGASAGNGTLQDIAAFAPNLEQLYCQCLEIDASSRGSSSGSNVLPFCSHFGGQEVQIVGAASRAAGGAAFAKAFPKLQVISCLPHTIKIAAEQKHHGKWSMAPGELLMLRKSLRAGACTIMQSLCESQPDSCWAKLISEQVVRLVVAADVAALG
jgi:hypothetical protein